MPVINAHFATLGVGVVMGLDSVGMRRSGGVEEWRSGELESWRVGELEEWRVGELEWRSGGAEERRSGRLIWAGNAKQVLFTAQKQFVSSRSRGRINRFTDRIGFHNAQFLCIFNDHSRAASSG